MSVLMIVALVLVLIELVRSSGKNLTAWAVFLVILAILRPWNLQL